ncbi:uncharacterized protein LOC106720300 isoform X1 [Papilio machaon]|uniref:uncharacterized protein LOC106720300 isoform X1 n=1 Tax=Papilio machaon TaxID=76193 RepID=UPI001E6641EB|nr:uncharacterized protein LOC106720300 isoform X1 [Papilio machaon]
MKSSVALLLFGLVVFVATTSARPNYSESELSTFEEERELDHGMEQNRQHRRQRRRHSRQISDRYDNFSPWYYDVKRQLHIIEQQVKELNDYVKNRQSPSGPAYGGYLPQPIYIPVPSYPSSLLQPVQSSCSCNKSNNNPNLGNRFSEGNNNNVITIDEDDDDEGRPISFEPVNSNKPQARPPPPVEHGSVQAGLSPITTTTAKPKKTPGVCEAAILLCCRYSSDVQRECFQQYGCMKTYSTGLACSPKAIELVIKHFKDAYAPS